MSEPTVRQREIYEAVERTQSFTAAGRELGLTAGAISSGVRLFRKHTGADYPVHAPRQTGHSGPRRRVNTLVVEEHIARVRAIDALPDGGIGGRREARG